MAARPLRLPDLPVVPVLSDVSAALESRGCGVLVAPPGAGKTTLVPLALLDAGWLADTKVIMLEPRRLAARGAARWMASLLGESDAGGTVGYRVRGDTRVGPATRIEVVTEGVLTRMLLDDPTLSGAGVVVFDEFHERSLHADLGLALVLEARDLFRDDLRILVMSATLDAEPVAELLGGAPVIVSEGRAYPVETRWRSRPVEGWIEPATVRAVGDALSADEGDVLVFLPGAAEIRRTAEGLREAGLPPTVDLHLLHGGLFLAEQDRALAPSPPGRRKVVLATSIAETSLTIEGVRIVVDSGRMRVPRFDPGTGLTRLETVTVTRDAADQRRGRAGRTAPGVCWRLWTETEDRSLVPARRPEMEEADLSSLVLTLASWGGEASAMRWLSPPPAPALAQARELLQALDALDVEGRVTAHGSAMAELPVHPRIAHMLLRARALGLGPLGCDLAALAEERDFLVGDGRAPDPDVRLRLEAMGRVREGGRGRVTSVAGERVRIGALDRAVTEAERLRSLLGVGGEGPAPDEVERVGLLAAFAWPDRIGRRRAGAGQRYLLRNGRGAVLAGVPALATAEWIVAVELDGRGADARIFRAAPLDEEDLREHFGHAMDTLEAVSWNPGAARVEAFRRRVLGAITVQETSLDHPDPAAVAAALFQGVRASGLSALPSTRDTEHLRERLAFLHALDPEHWPDRSEATLLASLETWLLPFLDSTRPPRRLEELARVDLSEALLHGIPWAERSRLDELAPTHLEVPSGSRIPVDYSDPEAPVLAVRLQEVFGLTETPRVGGGRVPLTLHLLSPAHRPVQVTRDLASFWREGYFEVRKDLRGRYPKHYWPDDPLAAQATRRARPRKPPGKETSS